MKRILAIDGGGSRGLFAIQILRKIEQELKSRGETLNSYFHLIAGTSTGAIIASLIRIGKSLDEIEAFYFKEIPSIFTRALSIQYRHTAGPLEKSLKTIFGAPPGEPVGTPLWVPGQPFAEWSLGSERLLHPAGCDGPRYLMLVLMRTNSYSPWILTNHPGAKYNNPSRLDCNQQMPLWRLIKGSAAAPFYFPPQVLWLPKHPKPDSGPIGTNHYFVDGAVCGYNNPAFAAYRMATLDQHPFKWPAGKDKLLLVSVGMGDFDQNSLRTRPDRLDLIGAAKGALNYLMSSSSVEQDYLARMNAHCLTGPSIHQGTSSTFAADIIDREVHDLTDPPCKDPKFSYVRYQYTASRAELQSWKAKNIDLHFTARDRPSLNLFKDLGVAYADQWVSPVHLCLS